MNITQIFSIIVSAVIFVTVIRALTKQKLNEANSVLWLIIAVLTFIVGIFPKIIDRIAFALYIYYPPTLLFIGVSVMLLLITFKSSMDISRLDARVTELAISYSITNEENRQLKQKLKEFEQIGQEKSGQTSENTENGVFV
ncbi:MAG: DUF2304 domain-containing protein [Lachnospiraceae bacterium]|nr:DUF2304 domain-containing protein [Lachnospiraceae bacterium]